MLQELIDRKKLYKTLVYFLFMLLALFIQIVILPGVKIAGVRPFILPAAAVAVGMFEGGTWGAIFGMFLGFFGDMGFAENTVLFTISFALIGFAAGFVSDYLLSRNIPAFAASCFCATLFVSVLQMILPLIRGSSFGSLLLTALLQTLWALPLDLIFYPLAKRISQRFDGYTERKDVRA